MRVKENLTEVNFSYIVIVELNRIKTSPGLLVLCFSGLTGHPALCMALHRLEKQESCLLK